jgi:hypothetical protein
VNFAPSIPVDRLHPNDYNPNTMTEDEFSELVAEVRHLPAWRQSRSEGKAE